MMENPVRMARRYSGRRSEHTSCRRFGETAITFFSGRTSIATDWPTDASTSSTSPASSAVSSGFHDEFIRAGVLSLRSIRAVVDGRGWPHGRYGVHQRPRRRSRGERRQVDRLPGRLPLPAHAARGVPSRPRCRTTCRPPIWTEARRRCWSRGILWGNSPPTSSSHRGTWSRSRPAAVS